MNSRILLRLAPRRTLSRFAALVASVTAFVGCASRGVARAPNGSADGRFSIEFLDEETGERVLCRWTLRGSEDDIAEEGVGTSFDGTLHVGRWVIEGARLDADADDGVSFERAFDVEPGEFRFEEVRVEAEGTDDEAVENDP